MKHAKVFFALVFVSTSLPLVGFAQSEAAIIKLKLLEINNLVGLWETEAKLLGTEETGTTEIFWTLDSTYLQWNALVRVPSKNSVRSYTAFITYSVSTQNYVTTSFFSGSDFKVFHHKGWYNASEKKFYREAVNHFPNRGDELVRNTLDLSNPGRFTFLSWQSRDGAEKLAYEGEYTRLR